MIVTTGDLTHRLKSLQAFISNKATHRNFRVFVATETDWAGQSEAGQRARARGAHSGRVAALDILHYLKQHARPLQLKYLLLIGDARPDEGTVPMLRIAHHKENKNSLGADEVPNDPRVFNLIDSARHFTEWGPVISDYPYADLGTDWDADGDGFLDPAPGLVDGATLEPELYVGRIPYYGESSDYGTAADLDVILRRMIRYDQEQDIAWRYHIMLEHGKMPDAKAYMEEIGFNYTLISRFKSRVVGLPAIRSKTGREHIPNLEQIQDYGVGFKGCHSHGGPTGMEGFRSSEIAQIAHDKYPTVLTLGACDVGHIEHPNNLAFTLLRFQSVAVSGGTGSVTNFGGDGRYVARNKMSKEDLLFAGKSVGEAHWEWYGALYRRKKMVPMTAAKINIYGDPSAVPLRAGPTPPYPFFAKPVAGHFVVMVDPDRADRLPPYQMVLSNPHRTPVTVTARASHDWMHLEQKTIALRAKGSCDLSVSVDPERAAALAPGTYDGRVVLSSSDGYRCVRRFVLKIPVPDIRGLYTFEPGSRALKNLVGDSMRTLDEFSLPKSVTKFNQEDHPDEPQPQPFFSDGRVGGGMNGLYPVAGGLYPFEQEDFTFAVWVRLDQLSSLQPIRSRKRAPAVKTDRFDLLRADRFFRLTKAPQGIELSIAPYAELGEPDEQTVRGSWSWTAGQWVHLAFSVRQDDGVVCLYANGKRIAKGRLPARQIYATPMLEFGQFTGVYDELHIYSRVLGPEELALVKDGCYAEDPTPANEFSGLSPVRVELSAVTGLKPDELSVYLYAANGTEPLRKIEADARGRFVVDRLAEQTTYGWMMAAKDDRFRSAPWTFTTAKELIPNNLFEKQTRGWRGNLKWLHPTRKRPQAALDVVDRAVCRALDPIEPGKMHTLQVELGVGRKRTAEVELFYESKGKHCTLAKQVVCPPNRIESRAQASLSFYCAPDAQAANRPLFVSVAKGSGERAASSLQILRISMTAYDPGDQNLLPMLTRPLEDFEPTVRVGQIGFHIALDEWVVDPESQALEFEILDGPDWAYIQGGNTLFSNFGPDAEEVGPATFRLVATDPKGARLEFEIHLVVKR